jgi:putative ABC transport system permease protein
MLRNYFKTAWRNLVKNKSYSLLNILGLAMGMAVALIIGLWVYTQYSYNRSMPGYERIYQAWNKYNDNGEIDAGKAVALPLADELERSFPEVEYAAMTDWMNSYNLKTANNRISAAGGIVEKDFIKIFEMRFLQGNRESALEDPYSIVLTQSTAKALFGTADPMGKTVKLDNTNDLLVTGVIEDLPVNSSFRFTFLVPFDFQKKLPHIAKNLTNWRDKSNQCFVKLKPGVRMEAMQKRLKEMQKKLNPEDYKLWKIETLLHPMKDWRLLDAYTSEGFTGLISYVKLFSISGALVLLIACINFVNLSTARSEKRAKEVGIRKTIGSLRSGLIFQFLAESLLLCVVAFVVACFLVQLALPAFNDLTRQSISIPINNLYFWLAMLGYVLITGLLAGLRPAFYLSSFRPVAVLKGVHNTGHGSKFARKALVVAQFACSVALIISTVIIYQQVQYARERPLGYDANRLMMTYANSDIARNYTALKNELLNTGLVSAVAMSSSPVTYTWSNSRIDDWPGKRPDESMTMQTVAVADADYFKTMGMKLIQGRNFTGNGSTDSLDVVINEAAVQKMRTADPINQTLTWGNPSQKIRIIGVVENALMRSPFSPPEPAMFVYDPGWMGVISYRLQPKAPMQASIRNLEVIFKKYNQEADFAYEFVDDNYASKFNAEILVGKLSGLFAILAVFISCIGLFGLVAYVTEQRTREIGIRKVLGARVLQVWVLICKEFLSLVFIGCLVACPVAWYFAHDWLQQYHYRIAIGPEVFVLAALMALLITIITVSFKAIKAALANPVSSLKSD